MKTKEKFHKLIDEMEDDLTLEEYYHLIKTLNASESGRLWSSLTADEKQDLIISYDESFKPENLLAHEEVKDKYGKWLKK